MEVNQFAQVRKKAHRESIWVESIRTLTLPCSYLAYRLSFSPTLFNFTSLVCSFLSIWFLLSFNYFYAALFCFLVVYFDCVDGELARARSLESDFGAWSDGITDRISDLVMLMGCSAFYIAFFPYEFNLQWRALICFLAVASTTTWRYFTLYTQVSFHQKKKKQNCARYGFDKGSMYILLTFFIFSQRIDLLVYFFTLVVNLASLKLIIVGYINGLFPRK